MPTLATKFKKPLAKKIMVSDESLTVELEDGRTISVPTAWYPRLFYSSKKERKNWRLIGKGEGIHWELIDEDLSVESLLAGNPSEESQSSLKKWLDSRKK